MNILVWSNVKNDIRNINKKDSDCLGDNQFWDNHSQNAISVYSETELTQKEADTLQRLGVA